MILEERKKVLPPILIPVIILDFCCCCSFESFGFLFLFCFVCFVFFLSGLSKTRLQGGAWGEITLQFLRGPLGFRFRLRRPAESPLRGGLPSSSACTVVFRCSMLTPVLFQNTSVECVSLCAQGTHTL